MNDKKPTILIVEDDLDVADMVNAYFRVQGYDVHTVNWGADGVTSALSLLPDLIILDIRLPDIDGYEVAKQIRENRSTSNIPIIFLTERKNRQDKLKGLEIGGDDYVTKPFDIQELRLRVRNALRRNSQGSLTNPITNLPDGVLVDERLAELLDESDWAILMVSLQHLDPFREAYGFVASDDVLRAVSLMVQNALREVGSTNDFLGHLTSTDFGLVTHPGNLEELRTRINSRLEQSLEYFYPLKDRDISKGKRLAIKMAELGHKDGPFEDLDTLKTRLLRSRS